MVVHRQAEEDTKRKSGSQLTIAPFVWKPKTLASQPCWNTATRIPYAAPTESRLSATAVAAITSDRKVSSSSTKARPSTNRNTHGRRERICALKSYVPAVIPVTATSDVRQGRARSAGSRRRAASCSAAIDAASSPLPAIAKSMRATVLSGFTVTVNGANSSPVASARCAEERRTPRCICGVVDVRRLDDHDRRRLRARERLLDPFVGPDDLEVVWQVGEVRELRVHPEGRQRAATSTPRQRRRRHGSGRRRTRGDEAAPRRRRRAACRGRAGCAPGRRSSPSRCSTAGRTRQRPDHRRRARRSSSRGRSS